jgi:hypothetical protein
MPLDLLLCAIGTALGWLNQHPTIRMIVAGVAQNGIRQYNHMTPAERAKVDEIVRKGVKLVIRLGIPDAMEWARDGIHAEFPDLPDWMADRLAETAAQAVAEGGAALLEGMDKEKGTR